ncbi:MAG: hypothetical protein DMF80_03200 [Acidobacteria bacterium]|nr:MAG: hypothetical protein DMF80_03200 [Acidobacteriota bacterium]
MKLLRVGAALWLVTFVSVYAWVYGAANFVRLCDIAVILTCLAIMRGSALLLSSQAVSSLVVDITWDLDLVWRLALGRHLIGGTEYMWDPRYPLWVRLMSLFHVAWPPLLVLTLRRLGYDRRGFALQSAIAAVVLVASRFVLPGENLNFAFRDPFFHRAWGPAPVHLALTFAFLAGVVYWPTHRALQRLLPAAHA